MGRNKQNANSAAPAAAAADADADSSQPKPKPKTQPEPRPKALPRPPPLPNRDLYHRITFTYQASAFLSQLGNGYGNGVEGGGGGGGGGLVKHGESSTEGARGMEGVDMLGKGNAKGKTNAPGKDQGKGKKRAARITDMDRRAGVERGSLARLARRGMKDSKRMAAHNQLKLDVSLKRAMCSRCSTVLIPGLTSRVRNDADPVHLHKTRTTCLTCNTAAALPAPPQASPSAHHLPITASGDGSDSLSSAPPLIRPELAALDSALANDGPVRRARMARAARRGAGEGRVPFHAREAQVGGTEDGASETKPKGARPESGHVLWRGEERLSGWGG